MPKGAGRASTHHSPLCGSDTTEPRLNAKHRSQLVLEARGSCYADCPCPSPHKTSDAHPGQEVISASRPISRTQRGVLEVQTRTMLLTDSRPAVPSQVQITRPTPEHWLRSCPQAGWQLTGHLALASEAGSPAEIAHLPSADSWAREEPPTWCLGWRHAVGRLLPQRCGDSHLA